ncbi:MAG: ferredoxin [Pyrinomonadaceae bacterium]
MSDSEKPHPLNAPGGFYVVNECCTACDVPNSTAPELFAYDREMHCYVKRQPENKAELDKAILVTAYAELECVRYRGSDPDTIRRIAETGNAHLCDSPEAENIEPVFRNHVTFRCPNRFDLSAKLLAREFKQWLIDDAHEYLKYSFMPITPRANHVEFTFAWAKDQFHTVNFSDIDDGSIWHVFQSEDEKIGSRSVSRSLHDWLTGDPKISRVRWYSESEWTNSTGWKELPW